MSDGLKLQNAANVATIVAAIFATAAIWLGYYQFSETQKLTRDSLSLQVSALKNDREMKAVELFLKFNETQQDLATKPVPKKGEALFWRHNALLATTETVFRLTSEDAGWSETVDWMLEMQKPFLVQTEFRCKSFAETFLVRMRSTAPSLKCLPGKN